MPILKPIYTAVALVGIHITKPFQALLIDPETNNTTLSIAFPKLYDEPLTVKTDYLCTTSNQVFNFVQLKYFERSIPTNDTCSDIEQSCQSSKQEVINMMRMIIFKIADGFDTQRVQYLPSELMLMSLGHYSKFQH